MIRIVNDDNVYVFDEIGWGDTKFHTTDIAKTLLTNISTISQIEFFSREKVIAIKTENLIDYWFHDIDADLLDFMCRIPKLRRSVKWFFIKAGLPAFSTEKYPLLAAVLLGDNSAVDILE